ncbi:MAG: hypothetical protein KatS3mg018_0886 [Fimbriimonadales bacterium]|nr:MAG: hypothetical protein KatS3mg018_0886 [Fimbriimonadales bacterium]
MRQRREVGVPGAVGVGRVRGRDEKLFVRLLETLGESTPRFVDSRQRLTERDLRPASQVAPGRRRYRHAKSNHSQSPMRGFL